MQSNVNIPFYIAGGMFTTEGSTMMCALHGHYPTPARFLVHGVTINPAFSAQFGLMCSAVRLTGFVVKYDGSLWVCGPTINLYRLLFLMATKWPAIFTHQAGVHVYVDSAYIGAIVGKKGERVVAMKKEFSALPPLKVTLLCRCPHQHRRPPDQHGQVDAEDDGAAGSKRTESHRLRRRRDRRVGAIRGAGKVRSASISGVGL